MSFPNAVSEFNYYLDAATSPKEAEGASNDHGHFAVNKICWMIDEAIIKPEDAIQAIHGKIIEEDPEVVLLALQILNAVFYKCGSLAHKVVCTDFYMSLLKEIIETTENKNIKKTILNMLEEWAENFKYFPQYSAPQKLLQKLKNTEVSKTTNKCESKEVNSAAFKETNGLPIKPLKNTEKFDKNRMNETDLIKSNNNESADNQLDAEFREKEEEFKIHLREYQQKRKRDYIKYRKAVGLPPLSSDEEDNNDDQEKPCTELNATSRILSKELQQVKEQRLRLNNNIQKLRNNKHDDYVQSKNGALIKMQPCRNKHCECCNKKHKSKDDPEDYRISKSYPYDIRKIMESKQQLNQSIEEIRNIKHKAYWNQNKPLSSSTTNHEKMDLDDYELQDDSEDEQLQRAIELSNKIAKTKNIESKHKNDIKNSSSLGEVDEARYLEEALTASRLEAEAGKINTSDVVKDTLLSDKIEEKIIAKVIAESKLDVATGSMTGKQKWTNNEVKNIPFIEELDEEKILQKVLDLSKLDVGNKQTSTDENEIIQQKINESFVEEENKTFSPMPKMSEADIIDVVKKLSLNDTHISQSNSKEDTSVCIICFESRVLRQFMPCKHKCICNECAERYLSQKCPLCNEFYTAILRL